ncbi:acyltransferase family protein [Butyrivibrio sp. AE2032]|uniref:acyltransferase family protein n=1 Tax=Butyrivibrio sp. AE2032 TaxID=1458463 RepID=UPI00055452D4|nr:acyltransferase family protein [Butyrivibrio sp. AE2032]
MKKHEIKNTAGMFDLFKGLAMIMVIFVHTYPLFQDHYFETMFDGRGSILESGNIVAMILVTAFGLFVHPVMQGLFVIAGYGFRKTSMKKCLVKQSKALLLPYAISMVLLTILHLITHFSLYRYLKGSVIETCRIFAGSLLGLAKTTDYFGVKIFSNGPNWFLLALFWGIIVFNALLNYFPEKYVSYGVWTVSIIGWLISLGNTVPWCLSQGFISVLYIYIGYYVKKSKLFTRGISDIKTWKKVVYSVLVIIPYWIIQLMGFMDGMADSIYPFGMITIALNGLFSVLTIYVSLFFNVFRGPVASFLRKVGHYSIYVMCIHTIEMMGFPLYYFVDKWKGSITVGQFLFSLIRTAIIIAICFLFVKVKDVIVSKRVEAV